MEITFTINGNPVKINSGIVPFDTSLNTYIRTHANLRGTKFMCQEGGCGACIVTVKGIHPVTKKLETWGVNSCLFPVFSCHGLDVVTIEGIGNKNDGYHPAQSHLAQLNGTQCGYCSPGMVMNMYSLLESKNGKVTMEEVENSFGGNICRCTGYRPILDAFKSLAVDADPKLIELCKDIEDLPVKKCPKTGSSCSGSCQLTGLPRKAIHLTFDDDREWHKVFNLNEVFTILEKCEKRPYMLVGGNTAHGVYRRSTEMEVFIDITGIEELRSSSIGNVLELGGNVTLSEMMNILNKASNEQPSFKYCQQLVKHIDLVANVPVRNTGTIAGNLMIKHQNPKFPSDIFLILETIGAHLVISNRSGKIEKITLEKFLTYDMDRKIILKVILPQLCSAKFALRTYKIMPRAQNTHAYVNAGFLFELNDTKTEISSGRICYGGINEHFIHATQTEQLLNNKNIFDNETMQNIFASLAKELQPDWELPNASPEYRKNLAIALFYKAILSICPSEKLTRNYTSGGALLERPVSSGKQSFDTYEEKWPLTKPIRKYEAFIQTAGEAEYVNDIPYQQNELWAAFVPATEVNAIITNIDASKALALLGVHHFFSAKDIPGKNSFTNRKMVTIVENEEIFCSGLVLFKGQPAGLILADTLSLAQYAATLVEFSYEKTDKKIFPTVWDVLRDNDISRIFQESHNKTADGYGNDTAHTLNGRWESGGQYHFTMEPQTCVCVPSECGIDVYASTQWMDFCQVAIAEALKIPENSINMIVKRLGGAYGSRITRGSLIACASALACHMTHRPVRLVLSLETNMTVIGRRFPCIGEYEVEVDAKGKIQKLRNNFWQDFGCSLNESVVGLTTTWFRNCYDNKFWDIASKAVVTNAASNTFCRAPGIIEGVSMIENIMEHIAVVTKQDPVAVRLANMTEETPMRHILPEFLTSVDFELRKKEIDSFNKANRWRKRGIAVVPMEYPQEFFGTLPAMVSIYHSDGTVAICHGGIEMGQGVNTKAAQVAAQTLGLPLEYISFRPVNNMTSANCTVSGGSSTSEAISYAVMKACHILLERIKPVREEMKDATWAEITHACFNKNIDLTALYVYKAQEFQPYHVWGASCAEVEVDILTGNVQLIRVDILEDTGESMSPLVDVGQVEGAFIMGVGYWLHEEIIYEPNNGELLTNRTWNYHPPGPKDIPVDFRITFLHKSSNPVFVLRSKATGEPSLSMTVVVVFALRQALNSARADAGLSTDWYPMGQPSCAEHIFLKSGNNFKQFQL